MKDFFIMALGPLILLNINYIFAVKKINFGLIDIVWGLGFVIFSLLGVYVNDFNSIREILVFFVVGIWGLRLAIYLSLRNFGHEEDYRYKEMRSRWGKTANLQAYFKIYLLQFFLMLIVAMPITGSHYSKVDGINLFNYIGLLLWALGFIWETVADFQKSAFKKKPSNKTKLCRVGLWNLSRHPNYFGEALLWWGIGLLSFDFNNYWIFIGPAFINFLLLKVSGIPLIEKRHEAHADFHDYKSSTPSMIPKLSKIFLRK